MSQRKGLILAAHGSRRLESNQEVAEFAKQLASELIGIDYVASAFLELAHPRIDDAIDLAVKEGCTELVIVPYFLAAGRHVYEDVPQILAERQQAHPEVKMKLTNHLGASSALKQAVIQLL